MYKLVVITNSDTAIGFALAGVDLIVADSETAARQELTRAINDDQTGVIAIDEEFFGQIDDGLRAKIEKLYRPIVVPIPSKVDLKNVGEGHEILAAFIKRAVGFDIRLKA
jgi:V/A-type H+/Na+-transporting ATPase subunit F